MGSSCSLLEKSDEGPLVHQIQVNGAPVTDDAVATPVIIGILKLQEAMGTLPPRDKSQQQQHHHSQSQQSLTLCGRGEDVVLSTAMQTSNSLTVVDLATRAPKRGSNQLRSPLQADPRNAFVDNPLRAATAQKSSSTREFTVPTYAQQRHSLTSPEVTLMANHHNCCTLVSCVAVSSSLESGHADLFDATSLVAAGTHQTSDTLLSSQAQNSAHPWATEYGGFSVHRESSSGHPPQGGWPRRPIRRHIARRRRDAPDQRHVTFFSSAESAHPWATEYGGFSVHRESSSGHPPQGGRGSRTHSMVSALPEPSLDGFFVAVSGSPTSLIRASDIRDESRLPLFQEVTRSASLKSNLRRSAAASSAWGSVTSDAGNCAVQPALDLATFRKN
ncbi:Hypothetical protein, putative [Bodo saltans]|uniref:Uncharacterized protein n=1 Tax=Bodo saltans TaxID=75058 RepID=A0A0S4JKN0_BODSA|nr:Hypothetical protein, putative [Bodo saltans]|eukprot:CUG90680.1 Hypothetical protein, putative [Bodo saltans]